MKIICIGWNYGSHNAELYKEEKKEPVLFLKPETSLLRENKPFYLPDFSQQVEHEAELVVRIGKMGKNIGVKFAERYIDAITIESTLQHVTYRLRQKKPVHHGI